MREDDFRKDVWSELFLAKLQGQKMNQAYGQDFLDSLSDYHKCGVNQQKVY